MSATVEAAPEKGTTGPIRSPGNAFLGRVPKGCATSFGAAGCFATRRGEAVVLAPSGKTAVTYPYLDRRAMRVARQAVHRTGAEGSTPYRRCANSAEGGTRGTDRVQRPPKDRPRRRRSASPEGTRPGPPGRMRACPSRSASGTAPSTEGEPTVFVKDFRTDVSPLTRQHRRAPRLVERWDLVAFGTELGTTTPSSPNDPAEQRRRLTAQSLLAAGGDTEAMELDEDFLDALDHVMPPTGGLGSGVDRLVLFLTGPTIRQTPPFPLAHRR